MPRIRLIVTVSAILAGGVAAVTVPQPGLPIPNVDVSASQKLLEEKIVEKIVDTHPSSDPL